MKKAILVNLVVFLAVTASTSTAKAPVPAEYAPNEILVKFREPVANALEQQHQRGASAGRLNLSPGLNGLNARYRLKEIKPLFKDFKENRRRLESLKKKDKSLLTKTERHILRRLKRAPKGAMVPDLSRIYKMELDLDPGESLEEAVQAYNNNPHVEYAELNYVVSIRVIPNDPLYPIQWPLHNTGQMYPESGKYNPPPGTPDCDIDAPEAWAIETGSPEVVVAVVDTGVDYAHRDLDDNMWTDENGYHGYDYVNDDSDPKDDNGHGTHCAGTIAAEGGNAFDIAGVCWNAKIMAVKSLDFTGHGSETNAVEAFYYAVENGADVISNSWGGGSYSETAQQAITYAYSQGVVMVAAAGNGNSDSLYYPACYDHMISVAATNSNDEKASFSNYGERVDIAAPGVDVLSLRAAGTSRGTVYDDHTTVASGTSMACPHVAGACALALSISPDLQVDELEQILEESTDPIAVEICQSGRLNLGAACLRLIKPKGVVRIEREVYSCSAVVTFHLADRDLVAHGSQAVTVTADGGDLETVVLTEIAADTGFFEGDIQLSGDAVLNEDGILQVSHGEVITVTNDGTGSPATAEDTALVDCEPPGIFNINFSVFSTAAKVTFETDEPAAAFILYGLTCAGPYSESAEGPASATTHTFHLRGLPSETQHYFIVGANDPAGNQAIDSNQGQCYSFMTRPWSEGIRVPEEYETIQEAIDGAVDGQTVWVDAGVYTGAGNQRIEFKGKAITVKSVYGPELTIIDCQNTGRGFTFSNGEDANSVLDGLTIINGRSGDTPLPGYGGGIKCFCSSPTIRNCVITNCWADVAGGIWCRAEAAPCSPTFINCTITNNEADAGAGGGIYCENSSPTIINCTIAGNEAFDVGDKGHTGSGNGGGIYCSGGNPTIINSTITRNTAHGDWESMHGHGGGICCGGSVLLLVNTTIADNYCDYRGGALYCSNGNLTIRNCTI
ncbi:MAG: S8 family serine peptidase, partial [Planctomycetota bacterium]